jgi:hypothetical protein
MSRSDFATGPARLRRVTGPGHRDRIVPCDEIQSMKAAAGRIGRHEFASEPSPMWAPMRAAGQRIQNAQFGKAREIPICGPRFAIPMLTAQGIHARIMYHVTGDPAGRRWFRRRSSAAVSIDRLADLVPRRILELRLQPIAAEAAAP